MHARPQPPRVGTVVEVLPHNHQSTKPHRTSPPKKTVTKLLTGGAFSLRANLLVGYLAEVIHLPLTVPLEVMACIDIYVCICIIICACVCISCCLRLPLTVPLEVNDEDDVGVYCLGVHWSIDRS